jgi:GNAT superfamily N-acetyltransferase
MPRTRASASPPLTVRPLGRHDWPLVARLFGANGACGGCWCMWWRLPRHGKAWLAAKGEPNRRSLQRLVGEGAVHAVLAFAGAEAAGWCTFGPRASFPFLLASRALAREAPAGAWSVVCFFIPRRWQGQGVATALLAAATERALALGATEVEGFPVVPHGAGPIPAAFAYTGVPRLFRAAGYRPLRRPAGARPIYVRRA